MAWLGLMWSRCSIHGRAIRTTWCCGFGRVSMAAFVSSRTRPRRVSRTVARCTSPRTSKARGARYLCWIRSCATARRKNILWRFSPLNLNSGAYPWFLVKHCIHILIGDGRHVSNITIITFHPLAVAWNVFGIKELRRWRIFAQPMVWRWARVHEGLGDNRETRVDDVWLVNVKDEVGILDEVHPESVMKGIKEMFGVERELNSPQRQRIWLPRVHNLWIGDAVEHRLIIEEIKNVFDG